MEQPKGECFEEAVALCLVVVVLYPHQQIQAFPSVVVHLEEVWLPWVREGVYHDPYFFPSFQEVVTQHVEKIRALTFQEPVIKKLMIKYRLMT